MFSSSSEQGVLIYNGESLDEALEAAHAWLKFRTGSVTIEQDSLTIGRLERTGTEVQWDQLNEPSGTRENTPHESERAEAAVEIAEAAAERAAEAAEEAVETATEVEEAVGEAEDAIPEDSPPEVRAGMTEALEMIADLAEDAAEAAVSEAGVAEDAAEQAAEAESGNDVGLARSEAARAGAAAETAEEVAADVAPRRRGFAKAWWGE